MPISNLAGKELAERLQAALPNVVEEWDEAAVWVKPDHIAQIAHFLTVEPTLDFDFLNSISAVDFVEYFEVVYHLTSFQQQHCAVIKTRVYGRGEVSLPSVYSVWRGADFQEREIWDLMGVRFEGHPNMKRIMLWEGFEGHPLRKGLPLRGFLKSLARCPRQNRDIASRYGLIIAPSPIKGEEAEAQTWMTP